MKKATRYEQVEKTLLAGLENLYNSQDVLDFNKFALVILESLMLMRVIPAIHQWESCCEY